MHSSFTDGVGTLNIYHAREKTECVHIGADFSSQGKERTLSLTPHLPPTSLRFNIISIKLLSATKFLCVKTFG